MNGQFVGTLTPDSFFTGLLAGFAKIGESTLSGNRSDLHRAFFAAVSQSEKFDIQALGIDYDPLYGVSPWLDRALTRAQRDLQIRFPNPTYKQIQICYDADEAAEILGENQDFSDTFVSLARSISSALKAR